MKLSPVPEVVSGAAVPGALGVFLTHSGAKKVCVVTGPHVSKLPGFAVLLDAISASGREVALFDRTSADPTIQLASEAAEFARTAGVQAVVGVGGGSPLDTSKVVAALLANPELVVKDIIGADRIPGATVPLAAIPTTAGTGSEVTNISILTDTSDNIKKAVLSDRIVPGFAGLMPELTVGLPPATTAATGMDALCHASESYLSKKRNLYSDALGLAALRLISHNLPKVIANPEDLTARQAMLEASLMAGLAFNNSSVTAIHAFAYPLGGRYHIAHGLANSLMFAPVMRHNQASEPERFADLAEAVGAPRSPGAFVNAVERMRMKLPIPHTLREAGIPEDSLASMAADVMTVERLLSVNPAPIALADAERIFSEAFHG